MDIFEKLNATLEPLGGPLYIDAFVASVQAEKEARAAREAAAARQSENEARSQPASPAPAAPRRRRNQETAGSADEVAAYMNRDQIEGVDEEEVQEFLRERSGFIPMDDDE